jgi:protein-disulfide isomerase
MIGNGSTTTKLALIGALAVSAAACSQDNRAIEKKLDIIIEKLNAAPQARGGGPGNQPSGGAPQRAPRAEIDRSKTFSVPIDNDPFEGPADAPVTIVKAYDYACPFCDKIRPTMDEVREKYGKDVRVVYKQLVVHPRNAMAGALAFCAANRQQKGFEMDKLVWDQGWKKKALDVSDVPLTEQPPAQPGDKPKTQKCWDSEAGCANVVGYAKELGLNVDQFKADMKGICIQLVQKDVRDLQALGVSATPSFFINGRFTSGAAPLETYATLIDEELAKAKAKIAGGVPASQFYQKEIVEKGAKPGS